MKARWGLILIPPMLVSFLFLFGTQFLFLRASLFEELGLGRFGDELTLENYVNFVRDPFYYDSLLLSFKVSALVVIATVICAYPVAYTIARMRSRWAMVLLALIVISSFVSVIIKALGLIIIFGADGFLNSVILGLGISDTPIRIIGRVEGVVMGMMHYVLSFMVLLLFSVIQTIPRSFEEAAQIHGARRLNVMLRVVLPLSLPGIVGGSVIVFNMCMGAFVSAQVLGGGQILTLPVVIQRAIELDNELAMGAALSAVLLFTVLAINVVSTVFLGRLRFMKVHA
ncbi:MAG: ABC transporter permease [Roseovarius sp.]|nr:ABC transporter permease [Roseovarius sp.]